MTAMNVEVVDPADGEVPPVPPMGHEIASVSDAPDWLVDVVARQSRLMSSSPKSVANAVWWEFHKRLELEMRERVEISGETLRATLDYRLKDREDGHTLPGFRGGKVPPHLLDAEHQHRQAEER